METTKTTYEAPSTEVLEIEVEQIIAQSMDPENRDW